MPYIGTFHTLLKINIQHFAMNFVKLYFDSFEIKSYFSYNDPIPDDFKSSLVYQCTSTRCSSSYNGRTCCHFKTRIEEHQKE